MSCSRRAQLRASCFGAKRIANAGTKRAPRSQPADAAAWRAQGTLSGWPGDVGERRKMVARLSTLQTQLRKMDADAERSAAQEQHGKRGAR